MDLRGAGPDAYPHLQLIGATDESLIRHFEVASPSNESRTLPGRLTPEPQFDADGRIPIPQTPGSGLELDWTYITTHRLA
jgi:L-alanine-DL-glutamate epimerase-like enolase superfamily enzyme